MDQVHICKQYIPCVDEQKYAPSSRWHTVSSKCQKYTFFSVSPPAEEILLKKDYPSKFYQNNSFMASSYLQIAVTFVFKHYVVTISSPILLNGVIISHIFCFFISSINERATFAASSTPCASNFCKILKTELNYQKGLKTIKNVSWFIAFLYFPYKNICIKCFYWKHIFQWSQKIFFFPTALPRKQYYPGIVRGPRW